METGTARYGRSNCAGDGCSTIIFADWVRKHGGEFYSVDIDAGSLKNAEEGLAEMQPFANLIHSDSVDFLKNFNHPIDFLYLDSFDFDLMNADRARLSQEHHLKEIIAAYPHLSPHCVIMIDDCALPMGGKGKLVIEFLQAMGWKIMIESYQVVLSR